MKSFMNYLSSLRQPWRKDKLKERIGSIEKIIALSANGKALLESGFGESS